MSETVRSYGFIAVLSEPIPNDEREGLQERLWDEETGLSINYEGTLVHWDANANAPYDTRSDFYGLSLQGEAGAKTGDPMTIVEKAGLSVVGSTIRSYNCIWYNGSDNPVDELTKEQFLQRTGQAA